MAGGIPVHGENRKLGAFAGIAVGIAESYPEIDDIINSKDPWNIKGARLSTQVSAVAFNFLTGIVTGPAHLLLTSPPVQGYCDAVDLARGRQLGTCQQTLSAFDVSLQSAAQQISDGNNIYMFVNTTISPGVSRLIGL